MSTLTIDEFKAIMHTVAGEDDVVDLSGDVTDTPMGELGFDSLAVLEIASVVQQRYQIEVPDECIERMTTPAESVAYINELTAAVIA
jgi:act minimal PKS acyl carrier protein